MVFRLVDPLQHRLHVALGTGDVDRLWVLWTCVAKEVLLGPSFTMTDLGDSNPTAFLLATPANLQRGRGTDGITKEVRLCPRLRGGHCQPTTCQPARLKAAMGSLRPVLRCLSRPGPGCRAADEQDLGRLQALLNRLGHVCSLSLKCSRDLTGGTLDCLATEDELCCLEVVMQGRVRTLQTHKDGAALQA